MEVRNLKKSFEVVEAVKGISFVVRKGEILGLLGPNGAGKTTTIRILTGLIVNYQGEVRYRGRVFSPYDKDCKRIIGVVPQHNNLDKELNVYQNLKLHGFLFGLSGKRLEERIEKVLEISGLSEHKHRKVDYLSGGMKRRLVIARALLHEPEILYLDEPTVGLDPAVRRSMWDFVLRLHSMGKTVILTTHYIEEADMLSNRVLIMDRGRIVCEGEPEKLKAQLGRFVLEIHTEKGIQEEFFESRKEAVERAKAISHPVRIREVNLEDVFLKYTGRRIEV
ncbi:ABC transporter ATP-binding protein [Thermosulfidibacter takaii]|uniref:ABC transporter ATP-binding protein n=1 Tax=Thermosulfidibacter takaii TaxID=412593 RepID=UPI001E3794CD|nr:ABC transporter ATP-binding protein [Thermosulfidibacter takaii]